MKEGKNNKVIDFKSAKNDSKHPFHSKYGNYKPNEDLLQSTTRIKNQRDVIRERIDRMEAARARVSKNVYEKVKRDYMLQLQTITDLLNEKKQALKKEIKDLYLRREKLSVEISRHREILEEAEFRHFLGEFSQSQFQEVENFETKEIEKLESDLARIGQFIQEHEELFDPEDLGAGEATKTLARATPLPKPASQERQAPPHPAAQGKPASPPQPSPAAPKAKSVETTEFEDLFLDEEPQDEAALAESRSAIEKIIDEEPLSAPGTDAKASQGDYFKQEKVSEDSFTLKKKDLVSKAQDEVPGAKKEVPAPEAKTDVRFKPEIQEDSISDILESLQIQESPPADEKKAPKQAATEVQLEEGAEYFLQLVEGELDQDKFPLKQNTSIGRSPSNDIVLKAPKVSRQHAAINMYNNQYIIIDLKSSNGVYVNGAKVDESVLHEGDEISIGGYKFKFSKK